MNPIAAAHALIRVMLIDIAPTWRAEIRADRRVAIDPGLSTATTIVKTWLSDLCRNRDAALETGRLAEALRRAFVCAASRGTVHVPTDPAEAPYMATSALDMALVETIREVAALLDTARGTSVATDYDAYREDVVARTFNLARGATEARRTCRPGNN